MTTSLWAAVQGGGNCIYPIGKRLDFFATNVTKKLEHYKPDLKALEVHTQVFVENLLKRSVRLDIVATDSAGTKYNVEIQRADKGADQKRARYNASAMDIGILPKGDDFDSLPEMYVIFITENDVLKRGEPVSRIRRRFDNTYETLGYGSLQWSGWSA